MTKEDSQQSDEPIVTINCVRLNHAQSLALRGAVAHMLTDLTEPEDPELVSEIDALYKMRLIEIEDIMFLHAPANATGGKR